MPATLKLINISDSRVNENQLNRPYSVAVVLAP